MSLKERTLIGCSIKNERDENKQQTEGCSEFALVHLRISIRKCIYNHMRHLEKKKLIKMNHIKKVSKHFCLQFVLLHSWFQYYLTQVQIQGFSSVLKKSKFN